MNDKIDLKALDDDGDDHFLRETMAGHRVDPKPGLWKGISRKLLWNELIHFNFINLSPKLWVTGAAGLLLVVTTLYFGYHVTTSEPAPKKPNGAMIPVAFSAGNKVTQHSAVLFANSNHKSTENSDVAKQSSPPSVEKMITTGVVQEPKQVSAIQKLPKGSVNTMLPDYILASEDLNATGSSTATNGQLDDLSGASPMQPLEAYLLGLSPVADTTITLVNATGIVKFKKVAPSAGRFFSANLGIAPELAFYTKPEAYTKTNFWLNGGVKCHISRFSVATGFSLGYVYDDGKYSVEYKSRDSVGYFTGVTSYTIGAGNEIIYNTKTINVYDSLQHLADFRTKNRYSYLQVPLLFGYRFYESTRISIAFQVGPAVSFLLGSRKSDPVIEFDNARLIRVDDDTPSRVQTNWQILANLYFEMRMNKQVSICLEPAFKYYLKPMVTRENVVYQAPWTIGLGIGLQFNFGQKQTNP